MISRGDADGAHRVTCSARTGTAALLLVELTPGLVKADLREALVSELEAVIEREVERV